MNFYIVTARGADLTTEADSGYTPMDLAVALGHKRGTFWLGENGVLVPIRTALLDQRQGLA